MAEEIGAFAVGGMVDGIAGTSERSSELLRQGRFVFRDKHSHIFPFY